VTWEFVTWETVQGAVRDYLSSGGPVLGILTLVLLWIGYQVSRRLLGRVLSSRAYEDEEVQNFLFVWRYVWLIGGVIIGVVSFSGSLTSLGISAAFLGMILGWSLQAPVTGIAAWLMIIVKRPFKIGDRVIIAGIIGDVVDISLTHVLLNQVGGTVGGEEKSGRGVLIPNATMFAQIIYNYTLEGGSPGNGSAESAATASTILDEVPVRLTFDSDVAEAERILLDAARRVTGEIVRDTGQEPFLRMEFFESGVLARLRFQTIAKERQRITSDIVRRILHEFGRSDRVEFCLPHMSLYHSPRPERAGTDEPAPAAV
jgi:small-conductance mechanosensitive channel